MGAQVEDARIARGLPDHHQRLLMDHWIRVLHPRGVPQVGDDARPRQQPHGSRSRAAFAGFAAPLLRTAAASEAAANAALASTIDKLRVAMFCGGAGTLARLRQVNRVIDGVGERA